MPPVPLQTKSDLIRSLLLGLKRIHDREARIIDYRPEDLNRIPAVCPKCGAPIVLNEETGTVYIIGPADLRFARRYGIQTEGKVTTIWYTWRCPTDDEHESGPIFLASAVP